MEKNTSYYLIAFSLLVILGLSGPILAEAATLSLSPSSGTYTVGDIFKVDIRLDRAGAPLDGVDIHYLNYPASLKVVDVGGNPVTNITVGTIFPNTIKNVVDSTNRRINFSQTCAGGTPYTGAVATLASFYFKVEASGTANVTFNYTAGSTTDCNVASAGSDVLTGVTNGSYTLQSATLTVSISANPNSGDAPLNGVDLTADVSGTATGNINYTFYCDRSDTGTNITAGYCKKEDDTAVDPYTATDCCDYASAGTYTVKVIAERGGLAAEDRAIVTVKYKKTDLNDDGFINSLDYSLLISDWGEVVASTDADINDDGIVNSIDWSLMNKDWTG